MQIRLKKLGYCFEVTGKIYSLKYHFQVVSENCKYVEENKIMLINLFLSQVLLVTK